MSSNGSKKAERLGKPCRCRVFQSSAKPEPAYRLARTGVLRLFGFSVRYSRVADFPSFGRMLFVVPQRFASYRVALPSYRMGGWRSVT